MFTPTQLEAIRSGMQPGLTLVVGPPGTGKTDVAVQIISNLYHNFPEQVNLAIMLEKRNTSHCTLLKAYKCKKSSWTLLF